MGNGCSTSRVEGHLLSYLVYPAFQSPQQWRPTPATGSCRANFYFLVMLPNSTFSLALKELVRQSRGMCQVSQEKDGKLEM